MPLASFHPLITEWFRDQLGTPTDIQQKAWPLIQGGRHVLVTAPTGCGKTMTAFLWAIHQLVSGAWETGQTRVLYVSPLKALNNDIQRNLLTPLAQLRDRFGTAGQVMPNIRVLTRSGDTPATQRQRMRREPPEILITTPESLNILLTSKSYHPLLAGVQTVILDEIHALLDSKRGTHLITAVDRLVLLAGDFQRIALSATVKPLEAVARFVGGYVQTGPERYEPREVVSVVSHHPKRYQLAVDFPEHAREALVDDSWWPALVERFKERLRANRSTLLFANSRRLVEKVSRLINEGEEAPLVYAHHGSLSKEIRLAVEQKLKQGELRGIVATNSLELGIDIGHLDEVLLIQTPFAISSTIQRLGRAGHQVGQVSRGAICPTHGADFLSAAVMAAAVYEGDIEPVTPVMGALDCLTQVLLSMVVTQPWDLDALYAFVKTSSPYHALPRRQFDLVVQMLEGRYADARIRELAPRVIVDRLENTIRAKDSAAFLLNTAGGTIPDRGYYDLRIEGSKAKIGELDEEFVWERSVGDSFALGNQVWRIGRITHNDVEVAPAENRLNILPFWRADARDAGYHFAAKVGTFLEWAEGALTGKGFRQALMRDYHMAAPAALELQDYLLRQRQANGQALPHRHHLLIEHFQDPANQKDAHQVILYTFWGGQVNRPFALALSMAWQERQGHPLQLFVNNEAILLLLPSECDATTLMCLVTSANVEAYLSKKLEQTAYFGALFRENAGRALLLPRQHFKKRMPLWLNRLRAKKLLQAMRRFDDFPILLETWRSCLQDSFDLDSLKACLDEVEAQVVQVTEVHTHRPSPFAEGLIWRQTNEHMYQDDTPLAADRISLKRDLIQDLLLSSQLRPQIPQALIRELEAKRQRTHPGYAPENADELLELVKDRLMIPDDEWLALYAAIERDSGEGEEGVLATLLGTLEPKLARLSRGDSTATSFVAARENAPRLVAVFSQGADRWRVTDLAGGALTCTPAEITQEGTEALAAIMAQWLGFYGPLPPERLRDLFELPSVTWEHLLEDLVESEQVLWDVLSEESEVREVCDVTNLEILLRMVRRSRQPAFQACPLASLPAFLAAHQGVGCTGDSPRALQGVLNQMFGLALPPQLWEEVVFPARLSRYFGSWLDTLAQEHGLIFVGHGDKKLSFTFAEDLELFLTPTTQETGPGDKLAIPETGRFTLLDLVQKTSLPTAKVTMTLWEGFWRSTLTVDAFAALRKGIASKFRVQHESKVTEGASMGTRGRRAFGRWRGDRPIAGNWYCLPKVEAIEDPVQAQEQARDRVRQLLSRYGILFRELLQREATLLQWRSVLRTLRLMEFSGEVVTGQFFTGLAGLQFMSQEAFAALRRGIDNERIFWLNACDPASLCGLGLEGLRETLPHRLAANDLVYHGDRVVLVSRRRGKSLHCHVEPGHLRMNDYLQLFKVRLQREFNPPRRIAVERVNDTAVLASPYLEDLLRFGFERNVDRVELWKRYR